MKLTTHTLFPWLWRGTRIALLAGASLALLGVHGAIADDAARAFPHPPPPSLPLGFVPGMFPFPPGINLSDEQEERLFVVLHAAAPAMHEQMKTLRRADEVMRGLEKDENAQPAALQAGAEQFGRASAAMRLSKAALDRQIAAILTPEQRRFWKAMPMPPGMPR